MVATGLALGLTVATLVAFTLLGTWYSRGRIEGIEDFITARGSAGTGTMTATLIASGMGAWILFSPAEAGAAFGGISAVLGYALGSAVPLLVYVLVGPRIRELIPEGHSLTEYAHARYGSAFYAYVVLVSVFYMFIFLAAEMTGIAGALSLVAGVPAWQTAALVGAFVLAYTAYGGLKASIFTDSIQTLIILPLLALGLGGALVALGGAGQVHGSIAAADPALLDVGFLPGLKFGAFVVIAILGAEMLNQAWWQRIYAARDEGALRRGFAVGAVAVLPMILLAGIFGVVAQGLGLVGEGNASISFFLVLQQALPDWALLAIVLLAVLLVMSTADTLFNAISSVATSDLPRLTDVSGGSLTRIARALTVVVAAGATAIGALGMSVLELFLVADLLAAATFVPLLVGLYTRRVGGVAALSSSLLGLGVGVAYFPTLRPLVPLAFLPTPSFLWSFAAAAGLSALGVAVAAALPGTAFDLSELARKIRRLDAAEGVER